MFRTGNDVQRTEFVRPQPQTSLLVIFATLETGGISPLLFDSLLFVRKTLKTFSRSVGKHAYAYKEFQRFHSKRSDETFKNPTSILLLLFLICTRKVRGKRDFLAKNADCPD